MSDHDRGAYTPHNDAPLSFDARQSRGRRGFPTTLVISLLILVALVVAIFMFYRSGVRGAGEAPVPVGAPVGEIKAPPPAQAQPQPDAAQGLQIYKSEGGETPSSAPPATFAPPPEQPQPRPAPSTPVAAQPIAPAAPAPAAPVAPPVQAPKAAAAPAAPAPKPAPAPVAAAKPAPPVSAKQTPKDEVGELLAARPPAKAAPAAPATANPARGAAVVQFGAFSSAALASTEWSKLAKAHPGEMAGKGKLVEAVERDGKTLFRGAVSGFASRADASAFCAKLKAAGQACIVR